MTIEGKWRNIARMVRTLLNDGWQQISIEPNDDFSLTTVIFSRGNKEAAEATTTEAPLPIPPLVSVLQGQTVIIL